MNEVTNLHDTSVEDVRALSALERVRLATKDRESGRKNTLDDESRVKILSPGMLVFKRFIRNKLAITGLFILLVMFVFAFIGPLFSPYTQTQIFTKMDVVQRDFASAAVIRDLLPTTVDGRSMPGSVKANFVLAKNRGESTFKARGKTYSLIKMSEHSYLVGESDKVTSFLTRSENRHWPEELAGDQEFLDAFQAAWDSEATTFMAHGQTYTLSRDRVETTVGVVKPYALMTDLTFYSAEPKYDKLVKSLPFRMAVSQAHAASQTEFTLDGVEYQVQIEDETFSKILTGGEEVALASTWLFTPTDRSRPLSLDFITIFAHNLKEGNDRFTAPGLDVDGKEAEVEYHINRSNFIYKITAPKAMRLHDIYAPPSKEHWGGTDEKAMDMMTRLMYGGRISLMVGFVVVLIENLIGVLLGGISGYFGGWVDLFLMRFIDLFNCIPYWPIMIIMGSVMDAMEIDSTVRIFILMFILGLMGWTGIARVVRGQILMLREQDFMIATECTGLSVRKRIFRHLVPNVMPLLIVQATMALGSIIIAEATLSFLGLGVKPPLASWGSIINAANNLHVMQNCWWVWIPTGFLIVITVLGFNFMGDGLRDAYDPKMKR